MAAAIRVAFSLSFLSPFARLEERDKRLNDAWFPELSNAKIHLPGLPARSSATSGSIKGHVKNKIHPRHLSEDFFLDSLPLLRRELLPISVTCHFPGVPVRLSLRAPRACGSFRCSGQPFLFRFQILFRPVTG